MSTVATTTDMHIYFIQPRLHREGAGGWFEPVWSSKASPLVLRQNKDRALARLIAEGERCAEAAAHVYLEDHPEEQEVGVYHSWPSPGPTYRFVGNVRRDDLGIRRPA
jgi:hypothetical protein